MTTELQRPPRKNPQARTRAPLLPPSARSRAAHWLTWAAAEGRFALPGCVSCGVVHYPARDLCPACLGLDIALHDVSPWGRLIATTVVRTSNNSYFRERTPWRIGTVLLEAGPSVVTHVHGACVEGSRVRLELKLDKAGQAVLAALPETDTPHMADDPQMRELTLDPKFRRVLITDGRSAVGQAAAHAFAAAGSSSVFIGVCDQWKPFAGLAALAKLQGAEIVALDLTSTESVQTLAAGLGAKVDILVNSADHVRPGGLLDRHGIAIARDEMELGYFGLMRLAQAFGPIMRARGADGVNSACAWVNLLSVYAHMNWPQYGAFSAAQAALLSGAQSLRAELRPGGLRVVNVFSGPLETEWFQTVEPPKVAPAQLANAIVEALRRGLEDVYVGDVAQDLRQRLAANPKALERELGA